MPQKASKTVENVSANHYLKSCEPQKPSTAFHNHNMLTLISTYFLRASFAVIFLVLTSSLQHWSSMVKRIVLCTVSSLWTLVRERGALHSDSSASTSTDLNSQVTHLVSNFSNVVYKKQYLYAKREICACFLGVWWCMVGVVSVSCSFILQSHLCFWEIRPPTSCIWQAEFDTLYQWVSVCQIPQVRCHLSTNLTHPGLIHRLSSRLHRVIYHTKETENTNRLKTLSLWKIWGYRQGTRFSVVKVVMVETGKCLVIVPSV